MSPLTEREIYKKLKLLFTHKGFYVSDLTRCASCPGIPDWLLFTDTKLYFIEIKKLSSYTFSTVQYFWQLGLTERLKDNKEIFYHCLVIDNFNFDGLKTKIYFTEYPCLSNESKPDKMITLEEYLQVLDLPKG